MWMWHIHEHYVLNMNWEHSHKPSLGYTICKKKVWKKTPCLEFFNITQTLSICTKFEAMIKIKRPSFTPTQATGNVSMHVYVYVYVRVREKHSSKPQQTSMFAGLIMGL